MKPYLNITDPSLAKALVHPLRARIFLLLSEREASPSELAEKLSAPLGNVSYHVRMLVTLGLIKLERTTPRRGSIEHHYSAAVRPLVSDEAWTRLPDAMKHSTVHAVLDQAGSDIRNAALTNGFDRAEAHLSRTMLRVDSKGWQDIAEATKQYREQINQIENESSVRIEKDGLKEEQLMAILMVFDYQASAPDEDDSEPSEPHSEDSESGNHGTKKDKQRSLSGK